MSVSFIQTLPVLSTVILPYALVDHWVCKKEGGSINLIIISTVSPLAKLTKKSVEYDPNPLERVC